MEALHDVLKNKTPTPTKSGPERRISPRKRSISSPGTRSRTSPSPAKKQRGSPDELALKEPVPSPHRRRSLRRSVRNNRRRTLPSIHDNAADLSKAISFELPESDRLSELLQSCFQFSVKKLEDSLNNSDGFNQESFRLKASSVRQKLKRFTERLSRDGTLKKCTEQPISFESNPEAEALKEQIKECISKFSHEGQKWDELLEDYKQKAEELSRQFTENKFPEAQSASVSQLPTSQDNIIHSKPDYRSLLNQQGAVFNCMELVLDQLQGSMQLLNSFLEDTTQHLQTMSTQLKSQSFKPVEDSPVRKFLKLPQK
ncbi:kinetochore-associated protein DSN1 homolog [Spea bombifrons]|uniref:kinetochore-associated protein DSN1 homolog n=1 Tax=Spea bombifrons TaxID=233779 RepID=UPI002349542C|nr:kinetochore-associated protein DSN1 homolog [Spea bombifrons]XP_053320754.1 kinetochore-associated protein DSN1 homolog [Spea bombifrons]